MRPAVRHRLPRDRSGAVGLALLALFAAAALLAPVLFPGDPLALTGPPLLHPFTDPAHPLGTDTLGRDVLAELVHGTRTTLAVALLSAAVALVVGTLVGTLAGFLGGFADEALMRLTDAFQTVPAFLLALACVSAAGPSLPTIVAAVALGAWTQPARIARAEVLSLRERDHVAAARVAGAGPVEIALREVLPGALTPVLSLAAVIVAGAVLTEAALSFLGFGDPNRVTWGSMIADGRTVLRAAPYLSVVPGLALVAMVLAVHLVGRGVVAALRVRPVVLP